MGVRFMGARWLVVEDGMERLSDEGLVTSRKDVDSTAIRASPEASGMPLEDASTAAEPPDL
jgi:hypothetical protein